MTERPECVTVDDLRANLDALLIIDVRGEDEFAAGHAPGARNIPLDQLAGAAPALMSDLPSGARAVTGCTKGGGRSAEGARVLRDSGLAQAQALPLCGGHNAWKDATTPPGNGE